MRHEDVGELLEYLFWVRERILAASATLSGREFGSTETVTNRDLRGTLRHQLENEWAWRIRLSEGAFPSGDVLPTEAPTLDALVDRWRQEERDWRAWLSSLTDRDLAASPPGDDNPLLMWRYLVYVVNHGTQQFSEAAVLLTRLGHSPGEIGYLAFCADRDAAG
jgi:uncharacterized damage-inducible protein DinB